MQAFCVDDEDVDELEDNFFSRSDLANATSQEEEKRTRSSVDAMKGIRCNCESTQWNILFSFFSPSINETIGKEKSRKLGEMGGGLVKIVG